MGSCAVGAAIVMSGVLLAQIEESEDDLKLTKEEGSWFGMVYIFQKYQPLSCFSYSSNSNYIGIIFYYLILYHVLLRIHTFNIIASH